MATHCELSETAESKCLCSSHKDALNFSEQWDFILKVVTFGYTMNLHLCLCVQGEGFLASRDTPINGIINFADSTHIFFLIHED